LSQALYDQNGKLTLAIKVTEAEASKGSALIALFDSASSFLIEPMTSATVPISMDGQAVFDIDALSPGTYAVSVIYAQDRNGKFKH